MRFYFESPREIHEGNRSPKEKDKVLVIEDQWKSAGQFWNEVLLWR